VLVISALANLVLVDMLPVCNELLWIDLFFTTCYAFCVISLLQSFMCIMVECHEEEQFFPLWLVTLCGKLAHLWDRVLLRPLGWSQDDAITQFFASPTDDNDGADVGAVDSLTYLAKRVDIQESMAGVLYRKLLMETGTLSQPPVVPALPVQVGEAELQKLVFFEKLFVDLDEDATGELSMEECSVCLSFLAPEMEVTKREAMIAQHNIYASDESITRLEFIMLCREALSHVPPSRLHDAVHNLRAVRNAPRRRVKLHWQSVSRRLDRYGRMVVPYTFLLAMIFIFNLELTDDYEINDLGRESSTGDASFTGIGPNGAKFTSTGWLFLTLALVIGAVCFLSWWQFDHAAAKALKRRRERERRALHQTTLRATSAAAPLNAEARGNADARGNATYGDANVHTVPSERAVIEEKGRSWVQRQKTAAGLEPQSARVAPQPGGDES